MDKQGWELKVGPGPYPVDAGVECSVWAQLADLEQRGKLVRADLEGCVLTTTAALNWNGLCREVVSFPSREV